MEKILYYIQETYTEKAVIPMALGDYYKNKEI